MSTLDSVSKTYGSFRAVSNLKVQVEDGEFFSLLGPSGCGKTTTLRMIAGFVPPTSGEVILSGEDVTRLPPEKRNVGIVFQNYAIFPHMTVAQNVGYGLKLRRMDKKLIAEQVERALQQVSMEGLANRMPSQLSGGQLQRVALARVIILEPKLLLLDEPLSALDKKLREEMRIWLKNLQHELGLTTIYVTHDQDEALFLSDRIAVMREGVIEQIGTPNEIYDSPATRFVADFIGDANIFPARVISRDGSVVHVETNVRRQSGMRNITCPSAQSQAGSNPPHDSAREDPGRNSGGKRRQQDQGKGSCNELPWIEEPNSPGNRIGGENLQ